MSKKHISNIDNSVDINLYWRYFVCNFEECNDVDCIYYYDKNNNDFVLKRFLSIEDQTNFDCQIGKRYIKLFQFVCETQYKSLIGLIDNKAVSEWFKSSQTEEERYGKYNRFVDWNSLYNFENYRLYLKIYPLVIDWCKENHLDIFFRGELSPNTDYEYLNSHLYSQKWEIPTD